MSELIPHQENALAPWDAREYTRTNVAFHTRIMEIGRNEYVLAEAPIVRMTSQVFTPIAFLHIEATRTAVDQHREIAAAIAAGDGDWPRNWRAATSRRRSSESEAPESQKAEAHG